MLTVATERVPRVMRGGRFKIESLGQGLFCVIAHIGFMELPDVPKLLREAERAGLEARTSDAVYFLGRDDIVTRCPRGMLLWRKKLFLFLARNAQYAAASFGIPPGRVMEVGGQMEI
jgi:KUP system potassium uptake protein